MTVENFIRMFAGAMILVSILLGASWSPVYQSGNWLFLTTFVGFNLFQSSFTGLCPLDRILRKMGMRSGGGACGV
ncbi:MAG: DUF2892 domain-containing protein [Gammaproteobacteria bacterium]|jgi:hypothetical protein